jgi:hypothetical protein
VKKTTKKQRATVLTSSLLTENKQKLKYTKVEGEKRKWKEAPKNQPGIRKLQSLALKKTAFNLEVNSQSRAECWENYYRKEGKMTEFGV